MLVFSPLDTELGKRNHCWAAGSRPWWEKSVCNKLNLIASEIHYFIFQTQHGQVLYSWMVEIFLYGCLISSDLSAIASHLNLLPPSLEVKKKVMIKNEEKLIATDEKQKRSVAASSFFWFSLLFWTHSHILPIVLGQFCQDLPSVLLLVKSSHMLPPPCSAASVFLVLSLLTMLQALTCISSTMATRSAREISLPMIKALSCRNLSSNCFREVESPSITSWSFSEGRGCPVKRGINTWGEKGHSSTHDHLLC